MVRTLRTSREGTIWVRRRGDEPASDGPIDLLTPGGGYLGTYAAGATDMPDAFGPAGLAAFILLDEFYSAQRRGAKTAGRRAVTPIQPK